jgi:hypothetical protein
MDEPPILKAKIRMEAINNYGVDYGCLMKYDATI